MADEKEEVQLIASGYDWICPKCQTFNRIAHITENVTCRSCGSTFPTTDDPDHAN